MTAPDFRAMGDPLNDRLPPVRRSGNRADAADRALQAQLGATCDGPDCERDGQEIVHRPSCERWEP